MRQKKENRMAGSDRQQLLFQLAFVLYTCATCLQSTMYTKYALMAKLLPYLRYLAFGLLSVLIALHIRGDIRRSRGMDAGQRIRFNRYGICCVLTGALTAAVSLKTGDRTTLFAAAFLFAARKRYLDNTLKISLVTQGILTIFVAASSMAGIIPDLLIKRDAIPIRHSLGFTYPSVCTAYLFFLLLLYLWVYEKRICGKDLFWIEVTNCLIYILTDTRIIFLLVNVLLVLAYFFCCRGLDRTCTVWLKKQRRAGSALYRIYTVLYDYFVVILFFFYIFLCLLDQASGGNSILDRILSGRLGLTVSAVKTYGIRLIADKIQWVGFGGAQDTDALLASYNFVDCSYAYVLLSYGLLLFLLLMVYLVLLQRYIRKKESVWKCILMLVVWIYCLLEPRLLEIQMNCFLLLGAPVLYTAPRRREMEENG